MKTIVVFCALLALVSSAPKDVIPAPKVDSNPTTIVDADSTIPEFVFDIQDLPDGYADARQEVKVVDGMLVEVNQTVNKPSEEGGAILAQFHIKVTPDKEGVAKAQLVLKEEDDGAKDNDPSDILSRNRRGVFDWIKRSISSPSGNFNNQPVTTGGHFGIKSSAPVPAVERNDISYVGDTDVNYVGTFPRANPDAEVFDAGLVRAEEERFLARRPQPTRSQPTRFQPIRAQPVWPQPIRSQPVHPQPVHPQPVRPQQVWSQPIRTQPLWSQPIRSQPIRSQPQVWYHHAPRSQPIRAEPLRSQPLRSHSVRKPLL